ncbi:MULTISPECIES: preprotein translocase subunit YajC [Henriciella]|jgi:preprotein translocase subunit YajC|uniref:Sec translocon accessory complex subunit YajC n=1 Tax=Henriciella algicola TaxID=1608422 RepID=A0A399RGK6_9PROT|nr:MULTISPECIES: preprotein translocase subunit YajC [Henriciella]RIJ28975.1 preprotein translocase subunit YajC [Henriciella algicola]HIG22050.1 preprotein translocase subunit YajC [Henriciella sp.]
MNSRLVLAGLTAASLAPLASAQEAGGATGGIIGQLIFFVPLILIFYFLLIRPANQRQKKHRQMIEAVVRGDTVITSGGLIGKVVKVTEQELSVELADGVRVRVVRSMIADVRSKNDPAPAANDTKAS